MFRSLSPLISIALAVSIFVFFARPMFAEIEEIQVETNEFREAVEKASEFNNVLQERLIDMNSFSALELERLETFVPSSIDEVRMLVDLEAMAKRNGMLFGNVDVNTPVADIYADANNSVSREVSINDFTSLEISFGLIGTYEQLKLMVADMERSLISMEIINFTFDTVDSDLQQYSLTIRTRALTSFVQ